MTLHDMFDVSPFKRHRYFFHWDAVMPRAVHYSTEVLRSNCTPGARNGLYCRRACAHGVSIKGLADYCLASGTKALCSVTEGYRTVQYRYNTVTILDSLVLQSVSIVLH